MLLFICVLHSLFHAAVTERASLALDTEFSFEVAEVREHTGVRNFFNSVEEPDKDEVEGFKASLVKMQGRAQCTDITQRGPQAGMCAYNRSVGDVEVDEEAFHKDPRSTLKKLGYTKRGFKAKLWQIGRALTGNRRQHLELSGSDAQQVVRNMYGIKVVKVPKKCFKELKAALTYEFGTDHEEHMKNIKKAKPRLVQLIKSVATGCENFDPADTWKGEGHDHIKQKDLPKEKQHEYRRHFKLLKPVMLGYWGILPELTYEKKNLLAIRVYDEMRVLRGDLELRQIWHYARCHMTSSIEERLREKVVEYRSESNRRWHLENLARLYRIMKFRRARLEWVELDANGTCISAPQRDPLCFIAEMGSYSSANFRMLLMFKERHWQSIGEAATGFSHHPLLFMKKFGFRFKDRWQRGDFGVKFSILLGPVVGAAQVGGIVLGTLTAGSTTLASLLADVLYTQIGLQVMASTSAGLVMFLVKEIFGIVTEPVKSHWSGTVTAEVMSTSIFQTMFEKFDDKIEAAILETRTQMDLTVEQLLTDPRVLTKVGDLKKDLKSAKEEEWLALGEDLEDELRRYVEEIVREEFLQEVVFETESKLENMAMLEDPSYGWLPWTRWGRYREGREREAITQKAVKFVDASSQLPSWQGRVIEIPKAMEWNRNLKVKFINSTTDTVTLTDDIKEGLWVQDFAAYSKANVDYLMWYDWKEYRRGGISKLKGKEIFFDADAGLHNCSALANGDECLAKIQEESKVHLVDSVSGLTKLFGKGATIKVLPQGQSDEKCKILLDPAIKRCLRVRDHEAYAAFQDDKPRSAVVNEWQSGRLNATTHIIDRVMDKVRKGKDVCGFDGNNTARAVATEITALAEEDLGADSVELEVEEEDEAQGATEEEEEEMKDVANAAHSNLCVDF